MELDCQGLDAESAYKLLIGAVVPRPIAWVTSVSPQGGVNLAPFSCFTFVSNRPPMVAISVGRLQGAYKDTARNIAERGEFVVNIADETQVEQVHLSSTEYPDDVSEVNELGLATAPSRRIATPRIADAPVSMECRLAQTLEFGELRSQLLVGEVLCFHVADRLYAGGKIDVMRFRPIARLGGPNYARLGEILTMKPVRVTPKS